MTQKQKAIFDLRCALSDARFIAASEVSNEPAAEKLVASLDKVHERTEAALKALYEDYDRDNDPPPDVTAYP